RRAAVAGAVAVFALGFLPWARSGRAVRSGFALARSARDLGLAGSPPLRVLLVMWALLPLLVAALAIAAVLDRRRLTASLTVTIGLLGIAASICVAVTALPLEIGPWCAALAGAFTA